MELVSESASLTFAVVAQNLWLNKEDVETTWPAVNDLPVDIKETAATGGKKVEKVAEQSSRNVEVGVEVEKG